MFLIYSLPQKVYLKALYLFIFVFWKYLQGATDLIRRAVKFRLFLVLIIRSTVHIARKTKLLTWDYSYSKKKK